MSDIVWPPDAPTTLVDLIPSYVYKQYSDDDDVLAFSNAFNGMAQQYVSWFAEILLPVITNPNVNGSLLDWVAQGLYGMRRPVLPSTFLTQDIGALDTYSFNGLVFNGFKRVGPTTFYSVNDDIFRRILIWQLWKGDGKIFNIRWLKRRVMRFLTGTDGSAGQTDQTYAVSVTFGADNQVNINIQTIRFISGGSGSIFNANMFNTFVFNGLTGVRTVQVPPSPYVEVFKAAVLAGVLELPFQFTYVVNIN